jgi:hypothetical protein
LIDVTIGEATYSVEVPGRRCMFCGHWRPDAEWGDGQRESDGTWREAWRRHCAEVMRRQEGRCSCGQPAVDVHHRVPRSRLPGRRNAAERHAFANLAGLCRRCHDTAHGRM